MTRPKGPAKRPKLPEWGYKFAMDQALRLKKKYPQGLTGHDLSVEFGCAQKTAVSAMNRHEFYAFDRRYCWEDVAAMLTYRQYNRLKQLNDRIGYGGKTMAYYYGIEVREDGGWNHTYTTGNYGKFFDEAARVIDKLLPQTIAPATLTELPALESGEIEGIEKRVGGKSIRLSAWEYQEK